MKPHLSFNEIRQNIFLLFCWLSFMYERHSTFCHENCIYYMYCWCYIYKTFVLLKLDRLGYIYFHRTSLQVDQQRAFGILWPDNYLPGSKITTWFVREIKLTFETGDLGLTCNTGPYRTNDQSCGWCPPSGVRIWCHMDTLTRDCVTNYTMWEDWCYNSGCSNIQIKARFTC